AYSVTAPRRGAGGSAAGLVTREEVTARLAMLPADQFPITATHAVELTSGDAHDRFAFTLRLLFGGLPHEDGDDGEQ
ncbi:MAG: hypothetical protein ACRYG2_37710, partial [Janthinobacterium lividum]